MTIEKSAVADERTSADEPDEQREPDAPDGQDDKPEAPKEQDEPAYVRDLRVQLAQAQTDARRAQGSADRAVSTATKEVQRLEKRLEQIETRGMDESELRAYRERRELERLREETTAGKDNGRLTDAQQDWKDFAERTLEAEGIAAENPTLKEAFLRRNGNSQDPADWKVNLGLAIADVRRAEAEAARTAGDTTRRDARVVERNARRREEPRVDKSSPSSRPVKDPRSMTDEEFDAYYADRKAGAVPRG